MIEVAGVTKWFGDKAVLSDVSFVLEPGDLVGLVGPSGSGKSVLLKIMASVIEPDAGKIVYSEQECKHDGSRDEMHVGFLFQEGALFDSFSVLENVAFPLRVAKDTSYSKESDVSFEELIPRREAMERAHEILCDVGLGDAWKKFPGQLSGGMRRRVGIARALVSRPELVLLDDPTGGLDPVAASVIMGLIRDLHAKYSPTIVLSSHDIRRLLPAVRRLVALFDGKLISNEKVGELEARAPAKVIDFLKTRYDFSAMERSRNRIRTIRENFLSGMGVPEPRPFVPDDFQLEAIESLKRGQDTLVVAPTGSGKTYIAVEAIREICKSGKRACYTAPLKALSNSKYTEFKQRFEPEFTVGLLTGDRKIDGDANIVISTTEIYRNELYSYTESYGLVVLDELHYLADPQRGPVWEESIILSPQSSTLLMLSASVSNGFELCEWIESIRKRPVHIITMTHRPVELRLGFLHPEHGVVPLEDDNGRVLEEVQRFYSGQADFRPGIRRRRRNFGKR